MFFGLENTMLIYKVGQKAQDKKIESQICTTSGNFSTNMCNPSSVDNTRAQSGSEKKLRKVTKENFAKLTQTFYIWSTRFLSIDNMDEIFQLHAFCPCKTFLQNFNDKIRSQDLRSLLRSTSNE